MNPSEGEGDGSMMSEAQRTAEPTPAAEMPESAPLVARTPEVLPPAPTATTSAQRMTFTSSPTIGLLIEALALAQLEFTTIEREHTAKVSSKRTGIEYSYDYADLAAVLTAVRSACARQGIAILQPPLVGQRSVTVTTLIAHKSGEFIRNELMLPLDDPNPQAVGSAITYARRYSLQALLGVAPEAPDDDAAAAMPKPRQNGNGHKPTVSMPERASVQAPPAPATFTLTSCAKKPSPGGDYWTAVTSLGKEVGTFNREIGEALDTAWKAKRPMRALVTHEKPGKTKTFHIVDEIVFAGGQ